MNDDLFTLVCTDTSDYAHWQTELLEHSWARAGIPGELVRLVATPNGESPPKHQFARVVQTGAQNTHPRLSEPYIPINRLFSLQQWLETERPVGTVLLLDCDMAFRAVPTIQSEPGAPVFQWWYDFRLVEPWLGALARLAPTAVPHIDPITWPCLIHTSDLRPLMRRWIDLTLALREEIGAWESDMVAFAAAVAERNLPTARSMVAAWTPWPDDVVGDAPIIHYCQSLLDKDGHELWSKRTYRPWEPIPEADLAALGYGRDLLRILGRYATLRSMAAAAHRLS